MRGEYASYRCQLAVAPPSLGVPLVVIVAGIVLVAFGVKEFVDAGKDMDDDEE
jgi:hypothetical protein